MQVNLDQLNDLYSKATQGEWLPSKTGTQRVDIQSKNFRESGCPLISAFFDGHEANAALIAALHNAWPQIVKELEAGRRLAEAVKNTKIRKITPNTDGTPLFWMECHCRHCSSATEGLKEALTTYYEA